MDEALLFIEANQAWIFVLLTGVGLIYLRQVLRDLQSLRSALFGLERERATRALTRSGMMLTLILGAGLATFVVATFVGPALPSSARPTPMPTISLLATPPLGTPDGTFASASPIAGEQTDTSGCLNPQATLSSPKPGESLSGIVDINGTADIDNFAFYKYEFRQQDDAESAWRAISAGTEPIVDDTLGRWDTTLVTPGNYLLRLVVTDTQGNAPLPCVVEVKVVPGPGP